MTLNEQHLIILSSIVKDGVASAFKTYEEQKYNAYLADMPTENPHVLAGFKKAAASDAKALFAAIGNELINAGRALGGKVKREKEEAK